MKGLTELELYIYVIDSPGVDSLVFGNGGIIVNDKIKLRVLDGKIFVGTVKDDQVIAVMEPSNPDTLRKIIETVIWMTKRWSDIERIINELDKYFREIIVEPMENRVEIKGVTSSELLKVFDELAFIMSGEDPDFFVNEVEEGAGFTVKYVVDIGVRLVAVSLSRNDEWSVDDVIGAIESVLSSL